MTAIGCINPQPSRGGHIVSRL